MEQTNQPQPQNQQAESAPKKGLNILLSIQYFIFAAISFWLFIGASNGNAHPKKSLLVTVSLVTTVFLFSKPSEFLRKKHGRNNRSISKYFAHWFIYLRNNIQFMDHKL